MLGTILLELFKEHPAQKKIQRKEFSLERGNTGREISRIWALDMAFQPGEKVDMAMIFSEISVSRK